MPNNSISTFPCAFCHFPLASAFYAWPVFVLIHLFMCRFCSSPSPCSFPQIFSQIPTANRESTHRPKVCRRTHTHTFSLYKHTQTHTHSLLSTTSLLPQCRPAPCSQWLKCETSLLFLSSPSQGALRHCAG